MSELVEDRGLSRILRDAVESDGGEPSIPCAEVKLQLAAQRQLSKKRKP